MVATADFGSRAEEFRHLKTIKGTAGGRKLGTEEKFEVQNFPSVPNFLPPAAPLIVSRPLYFLCANSIFTSSAASLLLRFFPNVSSSIIFFIF